MALETEMIESAVEVSQVIHQCLQARGWEPNTYRITMIRSTAYRGIYILVLSDHVRDFDDAQRFNLFDDIMDVLEPFRGDDFDQYQTINLVVWPMSMSGFSSGSRPEDDEYEVPEKLLNPGVADPRATSRKKTKAAQPDRP